MRHVLHEKDLGSVMYCWLSWPHHLVLFSAFNWESEQNDCIQCDLVKFDTLRPNCYQILHI